MSLTQVEQRRYDLHLSGYSYAKIGALEGVSAKNAHESVKKAKEKMMSEQNLIEPVKNLRYEMDSLIKVVKNQHEIIKASEKHFEVLNSMIDAILVEIDQSSLKQSVQKLTSELVMMNRELMKLNAK